MSRISLSAAQLDAAGVDPDSEFEFRAPAALVDRIQAGAIDDPILRQILPTRQERQRAPGDSLDPVGESGRAQGALLRKYAGRALLITTQACDVHCRYCFRRHFDYAAARAPRDFRAEFEQLRDDPGIGELILSGGDPLTLSNARLATLVQQAESVPHLHTLRIHTRTAVVKPERIDTALCQLLANTRLKTVVVTHANCAQELGDSAQHAASQLRAAGATLLNQAVLLRGVNDCADAQAALSRRLFDCGILPYYLHQLDRVAGAAHFFVPDGEARVILRALQATLPGYLVPKLVREVPEQPSKTPVGCETTS